MTDNELLLALSSMIDEKLKPFEHKLKEIKTDIHETTFRMQYPRNGKGENHNGARKRRGSYSKVD